MADFDPQDMLERYRERAAAVRRRQLPPVGGDERKMFIKQAEQDFMDYAIIADAKAELVDGVLTLTVDLNPKAD